eukprot:Amastigsp_a845114_107.p2 type:complete len:118 gc:universal Amastigsp_a845114_107:373-20(-)
MPEKTHRGAAPCRSSGRQSTAVALRGHVACCVRERSASALSGHPEASMAAEPLEPRASGTGYSRISAFSIVSEEAGRNEAPDRPWKRSDPPQRDLGNAQHQTQDSAPTSRATFAHQP